MTSDQIAGAGSLSLPAIPDEWEYVQLENLLTPDGLSYGIVQPGSDTADGVPIVRVKNLDQNGIRTDDILRVSREVEEQYRRSRLKGGEVLLSIVGSVGAAAIAPPDLAGWNVARAIAVIRVVNQVNHWVKYYLSSGIAQHYMHVWQTTTVQATLNLRDVRRLPIAVPPTPERDAIVTVLQALDDKIAINERLVCSENELAKTVYELNTEQGTTIRSIGTIAHVFDGPHATPEKTTSGPWFLSISSLQGGRLALRESAHLSNIDFERWTRRVEPCQGDVLFSYETRLGEAALMPPGIQACLGRRMALLRPRNKEFGPHMLLQAFLSKSFQDTIRQQTIHGATVDRLPLTTLPSWPIDLPEYGKQQLEEDLSQLDELAVSKERENEKLEALRDTLLPGLMSGQIRLRDAARIVEDVT